MSSANLAVARALFQIVPSDTVNFNRRARSVYVGVSGDVSFVDDEGTTVVLKAVPQGTWIPAECLRINASGTTASSLVGGV